MRCRHFIWTPSHTKRRCDLEESHEGRHHYPVFADTSGVGPETSTPSGSLSLSKFSTPAPLESAPDFPPSDFDAEENHRLLRAIGLRHGPRSLAEYELEEP